MKRPVITRTQQQAEIRARGMYGKLAYIRSVPARVAKESATTAMKSWLDGLTLLVRSVDLVCERCIGSSNEQDPIVRSIRTLLARPMSSYCFVVGKRGFANEIIGSGWSWDEAFAEAEAKEDRMLAISEAPRVP